MPIEKVHAFQVPDAEGISDLMRRSVVAWLQTGGKEQPTAASGFKLHKELAYNVLRGTGGVLAVYRVRPDTKALQRMKRWPAGVEKRLTKARRMRVFFWLALATRYKTR